MVDPYICDTVLDYPGIIRRNSLGGSSSSSQDKPSKGVTFATDVSRMVRLANCMLLLLHTLYPHVFLLPFFPSDKSQACGLSGLPHLKWDGCTHTCPAGRSLQLLAHLISKLHPSAGGHLPQHTHKLSSKKLDLPINANIWFSAIWQIWWFFFFFFLRWSTNCQPIMFMHFCIYTNEMTQNQGQSVAVETWWSRTR